VPLSDREKRLLDEMEAALLTEDPRLVSAMSATPMAPSRTRLVRGAAFLAVGVVTLFTGLVLQITPVGILGFIIALSGVIYAISSFSALPGSPASRSKRKKSTNTMKARMDKRWDSRGRE